MKLNSELDPKVRAKIEPWWGVKIGCCRDWLLVVERPDVETFILWNPGKMHAVDPIVTKREYITAAKPHKHAPEFKFGEPDTVTRKEAEEMFVGKNGWKTMPTNEDYWVDGDWLLYKAVRSPGGNVYAIQESKG